MNNALTRLLKSIGLSVAIMATLHLAAWLTGSDSLNSLVHNVWTGALVGLFAWLIAMRQENRKPSE